MNKIIFLSKLIEYTLCINNQVRDTVLNWESYLKSEWESNCIKKKMKNRKYHTVGTVPIYHTVGTVPKYYTVGTVPKYHTVGTVPKYHIVGTVPKYHIVGTVPKYHTVRTVPKSNWKIIERG